MSLDPIITNVLFMTVAFLVIALLVLVYTLSDILKKYADIKKGHDHIRLSILKQETEILQKAQDKAEEIIVESLKDSEMIEKQAQATQVQLSVLLEKQSDKIIKSFIEKMQSDLENAQQNYQKSLEKQIEANIEELKNFAKEIEEKTAAAMNTELEKQKEEKLQKMNEKIYEIVSSASGEIIGRSLSLDDHQDLIMEALEKARKEKGL